MSALTVPPLRITDASRFGRVAVLLGGVSSEREVSLNSGQNVLDALLARGVQAFAVDGVPALVEAIRAGKVDRVFNIMHGGDGENGVLQGLLQSLGVPYTGPGVLGSALTMDKIRTKQVWQAAGLPTASFVRIPAGGDLLAAVRTLGFPVFVKPSAEGSSVGVFKIEGDADLAPAVAFASTYPGELLAEQMLTGGEFTVAILGDLALPSVPIDPATGGYDYHAQSIAEDTQYLSPGLDDAGDEARIRALALDGFRAAGCSGWGRVDVMRHADGRFLLMEVNTAPGMTSHSLVPKEAAQVGIGFEDLCWRILEQTVPEVAGR